MNNKKARMACLFVDGEFNRLPFVAAVVAAAQRETAALTALAGRIGTVAIRVAASAAALTVVIAEALVFLAFTAWLSATVVAGKAVTAVWSMMARAVCAAWTGCITRTTSAARAAIATTAGGGTRLEFRLHPFYGMRLDALPGITLDVSQCSGIAVGSERYSDTGCAAAPGAADAVHVILGKLGQVKVDDVRNAGNVNAACCHIGGDQYAYLSAAQAGQRAVALTR